MVIGPSQAYVKAGSLASSYAPYSAVAQALVNALEQWFHEGFLPKPAYPTDFNVQINEQVGRSLNIPLPSEANVKEQVIEQLREQAMPATKDAVADAEKERNVAMTSRPRSFKAHSPPARLARKLLILGALPAVLMFAALMLFFTYVRLQDANDRVAEHSQIVADSLAPALEYAVVSGNTSVLNDIISESLRRSHADWIRVTNVRGDVIGFVSNANADASDRKRADVEARIATFAAPALDKNIYTAEILQKPLNMNGLDTPVWFDPGLSFVGGALRVGSVQVGVDPNLLASKRRGILWTSLALSTALLLLTMFLVNYFLTGILRPIRSIGLRIKALSHHDYSVTPVNQYRNSKELITIEIRLNELAQHLEEQRELQEHTLTQTRSALDQAERNSQAKSDFMDIASHELQTPLRAVLSTVKLIEGESLSNSQSEYLTTASRAAQDLLLVINDILEYSRLDRGTAVLRS
ncbi:MAG: hypothetical protein MH186_15255, partial [Marinobacter sp.]|nr:hypothetical protein [Marinobacter sp.]